MKYCLKYTNICTKLNRADEIQIKYIEDLGLVDFLEKYSSKRVNLLINPAYFPEGEVRKLIAIRNTYPQYNFTVALSSYNYELMTTLRKAIIPFYVAQPCMDWGMLNILLEAGVCDIDLSGPLAFELENVKRVLNSLDRKVQIRVTPNKVSDLYREKMDSLIGFFIRPEDVELYEDDIDVLDFEGLDRQDVFYSIYAEQKMFIGHLGQCIYDFKESVDNKGLITLFGERRKNCGRQCLKGGRCRRCYDLAALAKPMGNFAREKIMETLKKNQNNIYI